MSDTLAGYRGYNGSVDYSAEDKLLHGRVVGIRDVITFHGATVAELETSFKAAVDEYLAFCAKEDKPPDLPFKGSFNVRVGRDLHKRAALYAEQNEQKLNKVVQDALEAYLSRSS